MSLPKPFYQSERVTLYHGDAITVLGKFANGVADALICDPPYSSGGMIRGDRIQDVHTKYVQSDSDFGKMLPTFSGDNRDSFGYWFWMSIWLNECRRVVVPGGLGGVFTDWRQLPATTQAVQSGGWVWRGIVPWYKPNGRPTQGRWANQCEYFAWGTNGPRTLAGNGYPGFYQATSPNPSTRKHITQKPVEVMAGIVQPIHEGGTVLDPFLGSGTTGVACIKTGRKFIGIEIDEKYCEIAAKRIQKAEQEAAELLGVT